LRSSAAASLFLLFILTVASVFTAAIPTSAADIDASLPFDDGIEAEIADYASDEIVCREECGDIGLDAGDDNNNDAMHGEEEGQDFNSLFENLQEYNLMYIDTSFAWDNKTINAGHFDYKTLESGDSIKIPLVDSSQDKLYAHPIANQVTSRFGMRGNLWHYGTDVRLKTGDQVKCALDGIVRVIQYDRAGYGNVVVVRHHNGIETLYGHLSKVLVKPNQTINAGDIVGLGGNTGRSTGPHLHFEIRYYGEPFNPEYIIDFNDYALKSDTLVLTRDNFEYLTELRKTIYYTVRNGDNLSVIAKRYGTTVNNLCRLNGIKPQAILSIGRKLVVRSGSEADQKIVAANPAQPSPNAQNAQAPTVQADNTDISSDVYYTVRNGDNLSVIAKRYGMTVNDICKLNGINPQAVLSVGRRLVVRNGSEADQQMVAANPAQASSNERNTQAPAVQADNTEISPDVYYTVRNGDNLSVIAKRYGMTVNDICKLNGINPQAVLSIGRKLVVKSGN